MKKIALVLALSASVAFPALAEPTAIGTAISAMQTDMTTNLTLVGTALITLAAVVLGFKWVKAMLFGG